MVETIKELISDPVIMAGIINPDTGEIDLQDTFGDLMHGRFDDHEGDNNKIISDIEQEIKLLRDTLKDNKNKSIGEHESQKIGNTIKDLDKVVPSGKRGDVARRDALEDIKPEIEETNRRILELEKKLAEARDTKGRDLSSHTARLQQGYILLSREGGAWEVVAASADSLLREPVLKILEEIMALTPVILIVGGTRIPLGDDMDAAAISHIIMQYASFKSRSIRSGLWGGGVRYRI